MAIIPVIVEQHAEEAAFLWLLRDSAVIEPHYSLSDLAKLDDRTEAHIDGLRIAGDGGWEICKEALAWEEAGEIFTAAVLSFESGNDNRIKDVLQAGGQDPELSRGLVSALGWLTYPRAEKLIQRFLSSKSTLARRIGIAACAIHRQDPGDFLYDGLSSSDPYLRARILKAIGEIGKIGFADEVKDHLSDKDSNCRFYAAWSSSMLGKMAGLPVLQNIAETDSPYAEKACCMAVRRMKTSEANAWLRHIGRKSAQIRLAIIGFGALGDPAVIPSLIKAMQMPELARPAGEAFSMITSVDIAYEDLEGEWPEGFEARPSENPDDEDVEMDPDEDLPWPNPDLIHEWWGKNKNNFQKGTRYLYGMPISKEQCLYVLRYGYQRQRAAAAIELAMMNLGQPLFEVRAPGFRQQKLLGLK